MIKEYTFTIKFTTDRPLTEDELDDLMTDTVTQVIEPNEEATYETEEVSIEYAEIINEEEKARASRESISGICEECGQPQRDCLCD
jgi:hypothetical protein